MAQLANNRLDPGQGISSCSRVEDGFRLIGKCIFTASRITYVSGLQCSVGCSCDESLATASRSLPGSMQEADYFIAIFDDGPRPHVWRWEIARVSSPMGVRLSNCGYRSRMAAEFAGGRALKEFLVALAAEQIRDLRNQLRQAAPEMSLGHRAISGS